jgi:ABC-type multidrug transport system ATPase subunit
VLVNGKLFDNNFHNYAAYMRQEQMHMPAQTIKDVVEFSALMRLPQRMPTTDKIKFAGTVLAELSLQNLSEVPIGTLGDSGSPISPALCKQVSLAVELAMNPTLLLADDLIW